MCLIFESIDATCIRSTVLHTFGAGGPSRLDAYGWRRLCTSFGKASNDLCHSLALVARRICSSNVHPDGLKLFLACRLIALDKNPGVRLIGICEVPRRIIAKAILSVIRYDVMGAVGSLQLCGGQTAGIEAAVHAVRSVFHSDECRGVLLIDASNAFNSLNRSATLWNISNLHVRLLLQYYVTVIDLQLISMWMELFYTHVRAPHRVTHLQCRCMPWLPFLLLESYPR